MALSTKVISFGTGTGAAGTTIDVTLGFQPKAVIVVWNGRTESTDTVGRADSHIGRGFGVSNTARGCTVWSRQNGAAAETGATVITTSAIVYRVTTAGVADGALDIDATGNWPSDGIRFIVDTQFGADTRVLLFAIGGTDITNTFCSSFTTSTAAIGTDIDITAPGFQPDVVFTLSNGQTSLDTINAAVASVHYGVGLSATKQAVHTVMHDPGAASGDGGDYCLDSVEMMARHDTANPASILSRYDLVQMLATGFRYNNLEVTNAHHVVYLAIKGALWDQGSLQTQTDTTTAITASGLSFQPAGLLFESACRAESTQNAGTTPTRFSSGMATGASEEACVGEHGEDTAANMRVGTAIEFDNCYVNLANVAADGDPQTIQGAMHVESINNDGFTCKMSDADPSGTFVWWVAVGSAVASLTARKYHINQSIHRSQYF